MYVCRTKKDDDLTVADEPQNESIHVEIRSKNIIKYDCFNRVISDDSFNL